MKPTKLSGKRTGISFACLAALVWSMGCGSTQLSPQRTGNVLSFINSSNPATNPQPISVTSADLNRDGILDLAVPADGGLNVFLGHGDGTFRAAPFISMPQINNAVVADFNGDGKPDLALSLPDVNEIEVLLGNGDGTFHALRAMPFDCPNEVVSAGDLNGDGKADLFVVMFGAGEVAVLLGNGDGTFSVTSTLSIGGGPEYVVVGDFNRDGKTDLAVETYDAQTVTVLLGDGRGGFPSRVETPIPGNEPNSITAGDFNGDGILDVAVTNLNGGVGEAG